MLTKSANLKESKKTSVFITNLWFESCPSFTPHLEISLFGSKSTSLLQEVVWVECQICLLDINFPFHIFRDASERSDLDLHNDDVQFAGFASRGETAISKILFFFQKYFGGQSFLWGLFWTSDDVYLGFQSQGGSPCLRVSLPSCILRFTSGVTPADLLAASMAAELFSSTYLRTSIGRARDPDLSCMLLPHSVRPGRCSTN